jgi:hypothetical protein
LPRPCETNITSFDRRQPSSICRKLSNAVAGSPLRACSAATLGVARISQKRLPDARAIAMACSYAASAAAGSTSLKASPIAHHATLIELGTPVASAAARLRAASPAASWERLPTDSTCGSTTEAIDGEVVVSDAG